MFFFVLLWVNQVNVRPPTLWIKLLVHCTTPTSAELLIASLSGIRFASIGYNWACKPRTHMPSQKIPEEYGWEHDRALAIVNASSSRWWHVPNPNLWKSNVVKKKTTSKKTEETEPHDVTCWPLLPLIQGHQTRELGICHFAFAYCSAIWTTAFLRSRFRGFRLSAAPYAGKVSEDESNTFVKVRTCVGGAIAVP